MSDPNTNPQSQSQTGGSTENPNEDVANGTQSTVQPGEGGGADGAPGGGPTAPNTASDGGNTAANEGGTSGESGGATGGQ